MHFEKFDGKNNTKMQSFDDIPIYFRESSMFKHRIGNMSFGEFKRTKHFSYIRDETRIEDLDDFIHSLECLNHWSVTSLPGYVLHYMFCSDYGVFMIPSHLNLDNILVSKWNQKIIYGSIKFIDDKVLTFRRIHDNELYMNVIRMHHKKGYSKIECGWYTSAALIGDGDGDDSCDLFVWGGNDKDPGYRASQVYRHWFFNNESSDYVNEYPLYSSVEGNFIDVKCRGSSSFLCLRKDKKLFSWKDNGATFVPEGKFTKIVSGGYDGGDCAIRDVDIEGNGGNLVCWNRLHVILETPDKYIDVAKSYEVMTGININGNLSTWRRHDSIYKLAYSPEGEFTEVACSDSFCAGIKEDKTIVTWGDRCDVFSPEGKFKRLFANRNFCEFAAERFDGAIVRWDEDNLLSVHEGSFVDVALCEDHAVAIKSSDFHCYDGSVCGELVLLNGYYDVPEGMFCKITAGLNHFTCIKVDEDGKRSIVSFGDNSYSQCDGVPEGEPI